jgi:predicted KAP-like P-loop ATPase
VSESQPAVQSSLSADRPIENPAEDLFGFAPFASAVAMSIAHLRAPESFVIGLHGAWGAGKSSAVNLIKHYLKHTGTTKDRDLTIVEFNPWWFNGPDALANAFFSELGPVLDNSLPERTRNLFRALGRKLSMAGSVAGGLTGGAVSLAGDALGVEQTIPEEHARLAAALRLLDRRILVVIDDLDRLAPEEAMLVFKLVKSVGRLPNLIYLLVFDRQLAERVVTQNFPSEGPHFLEKIIQAAFELPPALTEDLRDLLLANVKRVMGEPEQAEIIRFMNLCYDVVFPEIILPRDVVRLTNSLEVSWMAVAGEVDRADFLSMETLRLFRPSVHRAIQRNKTMLCGSEIIPTNRADFSTEAERRLLVDVSAADADQVKRGLMRLFPALEGIWAQRYYGGGFGDTWHRERRVCVDVHFDTYFRFTVSDQTISAADLAAFIAVADDPAAVSRRFLEAVEIPRKRGGTQAALLLEELTALAPRLPENLIKPIIKGLFRVADQLDIPADRTRAFSIGDNPLRIHWLINRLVEQRLEVRERDVLIEDALSTASLAWAVDITLRCLRGHMPKNDGSFPDSHVLVSAEVAERMRLATLERVEAAAAEGSLWDLRDPVNILFRWRDLIGPEAIEHVRHWLRGQVEHDYAIVRLANGFISHTWSQSIDDHLAWRSDRVDADAVRKLVNADRFLQRIDELLVQASVSDAERVILERFKAVWKEESI